MTRDGYPKADESFLESIAVDSFLKAVGSSNKKAACQVLSQDPPTIEKALESVKLCIHSQEIVYGNTSPMVRQIEDADCQVRALSFNQNRPKVSWADQAKEHNKQLEKILQNNQQIMKQMIEQNQKFMASLLQKENKLTSSEVDQSPRRLTLDNIQCLGCHELVT